MHFLHTTLSGARSIILTTGSEKKCGHMGGKVLIPTSDHIRHLNAARLAADVCGVPTVIVCRTDAEAARLLTSDIDERDRAFIDRNKPRTSEGFYQLKDDGLAHSVERAINCAPFADLIWMETSVPSISDARDFAEAVLKVQNVEKADVTCRQV